MVSYDMLFCVKSKAVNAKPPLFRKRRVPDPQTEHPGEEQKIVGCFMFPLETERYTGIACGWDDKTQFASGRKGGARAASHDHDVCLQVAAFICGVFSHWRSIIHWKPPARVGVHVHERLPRRWCSTVAIERDPTSRRQEVGHLTI
jgi:hypothetical protein